MNGRKQKKAIQFDTKKSGGLFAMIFIIAMIGIVVGLTIYCIIEIVQNQQSEKIVELTDKMITSELKKQDGHSFLWKSVIIFVFAPIEIMAFIGWIQSIKQKNREGIRDAMIVFIICGILSIIVVAGYRDDYGYKTDKNCNWYITIENISYKYKSSGTRKLAPQYHAYIEGEEKSIEIPYKTYRSVEAGDEVYVVRNEDGTVRGIYSIEQYKYIGDRLKESN